MQLTYCNSKLECFNLRARKKRLSYTDSFPLSPGLALHNVYGFAATGKSTIADRRSPALSASPIYPSKILLVVTLASLAPRLVRRARKMDDL